MVDASGGTRRLELTVIEGRLAVCRLAPGIVVPDWARCGPLHAVVETTEELTLLTLESAVPDDVRAEKGFRALKVKGPLDFALTGVLAALVAPLSEAGISLFALSSFDTDYLLVRESDLVAAKEALSASGHRFAP